MKMAYSFSDALDLCSKYQYLKGMPFGSDGYFVDAIVVTPFDQNFKQRFFLYYMLFDNNAEEALQDYKGLLFDVCIVGRDCHDDLTHECLNIWLSRTEVVTAPFLQRSSTYNQNCV